MTDYSALAAQIDQSRSRFQIERFVVGQHHTLEMQYVQLVRELAGLQDAVEEGELIASKLDAEAEELRESGKRSADIEAELKERQAVSVRRRLISTRREMRMMEELFATYPSFTRDDVEEAQEQYWKERLLRTAALQALSGGVEWAQAEAVWQAGALPELLTANPFEALSNTNQPELPTLTWEHG
jgi:hypothetical protein